MKSIYVFWFMTYKMENFERYLTLAKLDKKPHQIEGVKWCINKEINGMSFDGGKTFIRGGIIADEMGLGKTIQILGTIVSNFKRHTLIVLPLILLDQWVTIIKKTLGHNALVYYGSKQKKIQLNDLNKAPIVVTTYGTVGINKRKGLNLLHQIKWNRVVYDEAHHLKNSSTSVHKGASKLKTEITWLVTGTPIQNHLSDFFSLCQMLNIPSSIYRRKTGLISIITNMILYRKKSDVGIQLPPLVQNVIPVNWAHPSERRLAVEFHDDNHIRYSCLLRLVRSKQICTYPQMVNKFLNTADKYFINIKTSDDDIEELALEKPQPQAQEENNKEIVSYIKELKEGVSYASKIDSVIQCIRTRLDNGNKKIIFCQYEAEIQIIAKQLEQYRAIVQIYDGSLTASQRRKVLSQKNSIDILIMQIQTACEGLNMQEFNEVYFVSPHWNPAIEDQAVARCYRIGQTSQVEVFRFYMTEMEKGNLSSLDQNCMHLQTKKRDIWKKIQHPSQVIM